VELRVLGPVEVVGDDGLRIGLSPKERILLARLAGGQRASVSDGTLIEAIWSTPPASALKTLQGLVYHVRQLLGQAVVLREGSGYRLGAVELDVDVAQLAWNAAREALDAGLRDRARDTLRGALGLFRGAPFVELEDDVTMSGVRRRVAELRLALAQLLFELDLQAGGTPALIGELEVLVNDDPTQERTWCLLVSALASSGRHADALNALARARRASSASGRGRNCSLSNTTCWNIVCRQPPPPWRPSPVGDPGCLGRSPHARTMCRWSGGVRNSPRCCAPTGPP
jgi:DNA-binding SARP family transcriptional activator